MAADEQEHGYSGNAMQHLTDSEYLRYIADQTFTTIESELIYRLEFHLAEPERPDTQDAEVRREVLENMDLDDLIKFINEKRKG